MKPPKPTVKRTRKQREIVVSYPNRLAAYASGDDTPKVSDAFKSAIADLGVAKINDGSLTDAERSCLANRDLRWEDGPDGVKLWTPSLLSKRNPKYTADFGWLLSEVLSARFGDEDESQIADWANSWRHWAHRYMSVLYDTARRKFISRGSNRLASDAAQALISPVESLRIFFLDYLPRSRTRDLLGKRPLPEQLLSSEINASLEHEVRDDFWEKSCVPLIKTKQQTGRRATNFQAVTLCKNVQLFLLFVAEKLSNVNDLEGNSEAKYSCPFVLHPVKRKYNKPPLAERRSLNYISDSSYSLRRKAYMYGDKSVAVSEEFKIAVDSIGKRKINLGQLKKEELADLRNQDLRWEDGPDGVKLWTAPNQEAMSKGNAPDFSWMYEATKSKWVDVHGSRREPSWVAEYSQSWASWGHRYLSLLYDASRSRAVSNGSKRPNTDSALTLVTPAMHIRYFLLEFLPTSSFITENRKWPQPRELLSSQWTPVQLSQLREELWDKCKVDRKKSVRDKTLWLVASRRTEEIQSFLDFIASRLTEEARSQGDESELYRCPFLPRTMTGNILVSDMSGGYVAPVSRSADKGCTWITRSYPTLAAWEPFVREYAISLKARVPSHLNALSVFFDRFLSTAGQSNTPAEKLVSQIAAHPLEFLLKANARKIPLTLDLVSGDARFPKLIAEFLEYLLKVHCAEEDEAGWTRLPEFENPFKDHLANFASVSTSVDFETLRPAMPYAWVQRHRAIIVQGPHFRDWVWAQKAMRGSAADWFEIDQSLIDTNDPDCVWRKRVVYRNGKVHRTYYEIWSPVRWVALVAKLNTALRTAQVRLLDSGESDHFRFDLLAWSRSCNVGYEAERTVDPWIENNLVERNNSLFESTVLQDQLLRPNRKKNGSDVWGNGVHRRVMSQSGGEWEADTVFYINTNKTADSRKEGAAKGFEVPLPMLPCPLDADEHDNWVQPVFSSEADRRVWLSSLGENMHWWFAKLRDWQEKYNPVERRLEWKELSGSRLLGEKSEAQYAMYRPACFLFREPAMKMSKRALGADFPIPDWVVSTAWWALNRELQQRFADEGRTNSDGSPIRLVQDDLGHHGKTCEFDLHSIRVSLITALVVDGKVPIEIVQRLVGHSRILMTLYYVKLSPAAMRRQLRDGMIRLTEKAAELEKEFLNNATLEKLRKEAVYVDERSALSALGVLTEPGLRPIVAWMRVIGGICPAGAVARDTKGGLSAGCFNGGEALGSGRYGPVAGGERQCPNCRWFITRPPFLPELVTLFEMAQYRAREADERGFQADRDRLAAIEAEDQAHLRRADQSEMMKLRRDVERTEELHVAICEQGITAKVTMGNVYRLIKRLLELINRTDADTSDDALVLSGGAEEMRILLEDTTSEMLQVARISRHAEIFPELDPGKAILRASQIMARKLAGDGMNPWLLLDLSEFEQCKITNGVIRQLARTLNPSNEEIGFRAAVKVIEGPESVADVLGIKRSSLGDYLASFSKRCDQPLQLGVLDEDE